jgi:pyrimidine deaminase RibD-like protein
MRLAIDEARLDQRPHRVGAVLVKNGEVLASAHGGAIRTKHHAESAILLGELAGTDVTGATLFTTLEPCTHRHHPHKHCAQLIVEARISQVFIGIRDPNPAIFGAGEWFLRKNGVKVQSFPEDLCNEIEALSAAWIAEQRARITYPQMFAKLPDHIAPELLSYPGAKLARVVSLRACPYITQGWLAQEVQLKHENVMYSLPAEETPRYAHYFEQEKERRGFHIDNPKVMLWNYPRSFTDEPTLILRTRKCLYSHCRYYNDGNRSQPGGIFSVN